VTTTNYVTVQGLPELRVALRASADGAPKESSAAIRAVGRDIVLPGIKAIAPVGRRPDDRHPGQLRAGYRISATMTQGSVVNTAPHSAGAEWGKSRRWSGWRKYPAPPGGGRFAWRTVFERQDQITAAIFEGMKAIVSAHGWFR
jgi:hypothetical protein